MTRIAKTLTKVTGPFDLVNSTLTVSETATYFRTGSTRKKEDNQ